MYAKVINGTIVKYPYSLEDLYTDNPGIYFPPDLNDDMLARFNTVRVIITGKPEYDLLTQNITESLPVYVNERNRWEQTWEVISLPPDNIAGNQARIKNDFLQKTKQRLDTFAASRGYDDISTACTYVTDPIEQHRVEAQYCVEARGRTWNEVFKILSDMETNQRPWTDDFSAIEDELPQLVWPT